MIDAIVRIEWIASYTVQYKNSEYKFTIEYEGSNQVECNSSERDLNSRDRPSWVDIVSNISHRFNLFNYVCLQSRACFIILY